MFNKNSKIQAIFIVFKLQSKPNYFLKLDLRKGFE